MSADTTPSDATAGGFWDRLGWRVSRRPLAPLGYVLGAAAGAFAVVATVALAVEVTSDDPTGPGVVLNLALFALAFAAGAKLPGPIRSAAVTALVLTTPLIWSFAFLGGGNAGSGGIRGIYLLSVATYFVLYMFGWTRGRAVLLGLALLFLSGWILFEVGGNSSTIVPFQDQIQSQTSSPFGDDDPYDGPSDESDDGTTTTGVVALLLGLGGLGVAVALDRRERLGASTPFLVVGAIYALTGAVIVGSNEDPTVAGVLVTLAGVAIGGVGNLGGTPRRGSIWIGVLAVVGGVATIIIDLTSDSVLGFAGLAALSAIVIGAIAVATGAHEGNDEEEPAVAAPPG